MDIKKVGVIGSGTMGASISVAIARAGYEVYLTDADSRALESGRERIERFFQSLVKKGMDSQAAAASRERIKSVEHIDDMAEADLVIEAVVERIEVKREVFQKLESCCRRTAILATNTSSLSITEIAACLSDPTRVVGLHFFNPAHLMKLVEVIPGLETSETIVEQALAFARSLEKLAVRVEECPSFLVNRLLGRYMNEALWCLEQGEAGVEEIDKAAADYAMPLGPLALRDMNGADIGLAVAEFNHKEYGERFRPAPILAHMVDKHWLGQKTGRGFYIYDAETKKRQGPNPELLALLPPVTSSETFFVERLFLPMINEAFLVLAEHVCSPSDLDPAMVAGLGMRKGPLSMAEDIGLARCLTDLERLASEHGERFRPAPLLKRYVRAGRTKVASAAKAQALTL